MDDIQTVRATLRANLDKLPAEKRGFAESILRPLLPSAGQEKWIRILADLATGAQQANTRSIANFDSIVALIARGKSQLRWPRMLFQSGNVALRLSIAGERSRTPGAINVTSIDLDPEKEGRTWFGRITTGGEFQPSMRELASTTSAIAAALVQIAADPAKAAAEYGHLTGRCCFCSRPLDDARSTTVGYGQTCAGRYGLPWGERKAA